MDPVTDYRHAGAAMVREYDRMIAELEQLREGVNDPTELLKTADLLYRLRAEQRRIVAKLVALQPD